MRELPQTIHIIISMGIRLQGNIELGERELEVGEATVHEFPRYIFRMIYEGRCENKFHCSFNNTFDRIYWYNHKITKKTFNETSSYSERHLINNNCSINCITIG